MFIRYKGFEEELHVTCLMGINMQKPYKFTPRSVLEVDDVDGAVLLRTPESFEGVDAPRVDAPAVFVPVVNPVVNHIKRRK